MQLNRIEKQILQISMEFEQVRSLNNRLILNSRRDNLIPNTCNHLIDNLVNNSNNVSSQIKPIKLLPIKNMKTKYHNHHFRNIANIIKEQIMNEKEVDLLDEELLNMKAEFEKRCERINSKQKLQLDGLEYINKKVFNNANLIDNVKNEVNKQN